jgi:hypothetical protein
MFIYIIGAGGQVRSGSVTPRVICPVIGVSYACSSIAFLFSSMLEVKAERRKMHSTRNVQWGGGGERDKKMDHLGSRASISSACPKDLSPRARARASGTERTKVRLQSMLLGKYSEPNCS